MDGNNFPLNVEDLQWRPAAYGFVLKDGKLLLSKQYDGYDLPGGGIDIGETPEEAVIREIKEETGVNASNPRFLAFRNMFIKHHGVEPRQALMFYYQCDYVDGELSIDGFDEHEKVYADMPEWIPLDELANIKPASTNDFRKYIELLV